MDVTDQIEAAKLKVTREAKMEYFERRIPECWRLLCVELNAFLNEKSEFWRLRFDSLEEYCEWMFGMSPERLLEVADKGMKAAFERGNTGLVQTLSYDRTEKKGDEVYVSREFIKPLAETMEAEKRVEASMERKAMTPAEKQRAYRERKKLEELNRRPPEQERPHGWGVKK